MDELAIFTHALDFERAEERAAFLEQACGADASLRARVEALLQSHQAAGSFLQEGPLAGTSPTTDQHSLESPGMVIGPYKLLQQIGEGGMGVVYMAEQSEPVQRKVAMKVIKPGMDSSQVIARFEAERQALAMMDHVNIARVFDGGTTENGRPYFVMELVYGVPITKYCDDNHLTPRQRLELFVPVCQAIQHAHQKGIIHRDIKPSNVMITLYDGKPVPKVIDFGVAKATEQKLTERTLFTQYGTMVGTLEYMSPEQAEMSALGVDTRSDIYSLGVLLYELLTGNTPLSHKTMKEAAYAEILRMIKEEEPPKPSTRLSDSGEALASISAQRHMEPAKLTKLVRGELDWIVMKTLEKDRNRRYETAKDFAADVQRYLTDEAVQACPPSAGYRFKKFARRNKRTLVTAALLGAMLLIAAGSFGWMASDRAARQTRTAAEVNQFLQRAKSHYADNNLPETVGEVQKARAVLEGGSGDEELGRRVRQWLTDLDTAAKLEEIRVEAFDLEDRDRGYADYARVFRDYGIDMEALSVEEATARMTASQIRLDLILALGNWAGRLRSDPRPQDPVRWRRLLAVSTAADPDPWQLRLIGTIETKDVQTLRELAHRAKPGRPRARTLVYLGTSLSAAGDTETAVAFLRRAQRQHPGDFLINSNLAICLSDLKPPPWYEVVAFFRVALAVRPRSAYAHFALATALKNQSRLDEAVVEYREAIRLRPAYVSAHNGLGNALLDQKKLVEAVQCFEKAIELDPEYADGHMNLGIALKRQNKFDEAFARYRRAIELAPKYAKAQLNLGIALYDQTKLDKAIDCYRKAIELDPNYALARVVLGKALGDQNKLDEAIDCFEKAIALDPFNADARYSLGVALMKQGKVAEAITFYRKALEIDSKFQHWQNLRDVSGAHNNLGAALAGQKKWDDAIACYKTAIASDPTNALAHNNLGLALTAQGKLEDAVAAFGEAIKVDSANADIPYNLGVAYYAQKNLDDAIVCFKQTIAVDPNCTKAHNNLGLCYLDQKSFDNAITSYKAALALDPKTASRHYNLGNAFRAHGKLDDAVACYKAAAELDRNDADAPFSLGLTLLDQNKLDDAIGWCKMAIALDLKCPEAHNVIGIALKRQNKLNEAVAEYRKAVALDSNNAHFQYNLGLAFHALNKTEEAIAAYREAIRLKPDYVNAHHNLGFEFAGQGKVNEAVIALREAVRLRPNYALAHYNLGGVLSRQGMADDAIAAHREAVRLEPGDACMHNGLGWELAKAGRVEEAIAAYREAIRLSDNYSPPHGNLAWLLATGPDPRFWDGTQAVELINKTGELAGKDGTYWRILGAAHYRTGNWKESLAALQKSTELRKGGDGFDWFFLAMAQWQLGNKDEARKWYDQSVAWMDTNQPENEELCRFRAEAAALLGVKVKET